MRHKSSLDTGMNNKYWTFVEIAVVFLEEKQWLKIESRT